MELTLLVLLANVINKTSGYSSSSGIKTAATYLMIIIVVVFLAYYSTKMLSKVNLFSGSTKYMKVIDKLPVSNDKSIILISVADKVEMIAVEKNMMTKIDDFDIAKFDVDVVQEMKKPKTFTEVLGVKRGKEFEE